LPKSSDRLTYPEWVESGKKDALKYAKERMEKILNEHKIISLTQDQEQTIEDILKEARKYYKKNGKISDEEWRLYQKDIRSKNYPYS
jgi:trimethylamine:corrinoid methyltransferase-like protein